MSPRSRALGAFALPALLAGLAFATAGCSAADPTRDPAAQAGSARASSPRGDVAQVVRAIDGDTIDVTVDGERRRVRLLGIDSPESTTLRTGSTECGGQEASSAMRALVAGSPRVVLSADATQDEEDRYGRLLAYVTPATGGPTLQEQMLAAGWAKVYEQRGEPIERDAAFRTAAAQAEQDRAGVWQRCGGEFRRPQ